MFRIVKLFIIACTIGLLLGIISSCKGGRHSGKSATKADDSLARFPYWIALMDSPGVNYELVVHAFDKYWEQREKPTEDNGEGKDIYGKDKSKEEKERESKRNIAYVYEYKQFLNWQQRNKNLVKPDGTIMTYDEILEQWKKNNNDTLRR